MKKDATEKDEIYKSQIVNAEHTFIHRKHLLFHRIADGLINSDAGQVPLNAISFGCLRN